ncbi:hypothetical protein ACFLRW_05750 [Acidobacteriota bacterium]
MRNRGINRGMNRLKAEGSFVYWTENSLDLELEITAEKSGENGFF